jgi:hypothetical protein
MPILAREPDHYPEHLFPGISPEKVEGTWWVLHAKPRQEKSLARDLRDRAIPFYLPQVQHRTQSRGRVFTSHIPLFPGYVFILSSQDGRVAALATGRAVRSLDVRDQAGLWRDLKQVHQLLTSGAPVTREDRLAPGVKVVIKTTSLAGLRGTIQKTLSGRRFIVAVDFIQQGAAVVLDDFNLEYAEE